MQPHRATLKKSKKSFKSKHRSKGQLDRADARRGGRQRVSVRSKSNRANKLDRRNRARQIAAEKTAKVLDHKRLGDADRAPKIVALVSLSEGLPVRRLRDLLTDQATGEAPDEEQVGPYTCAFPEHKQRVTFLEAPRDPLGFLDALKVADVLIIGMDAVEGVDEYGSYLVTLAHAQGLPTTIGALLNLDAVRPRKKRGSVKKAFVKDVHARFAQKPKVYDADTEAHVGALIRSMMAIKLRPLHWRTNRPYFCVDNVAYNSTGDGMGTVRLGGYLRGAPLSANQLVHVPGYGTFQIDQVVAPDDPCPVGSHHRSTGGDEPVVLETADPVYRETLAMYHEVETMEADQAWLMEAEMSAANQARKAKVPKGWSSYMASWAEEVDIGVDEDDDGANEGEGEPTAMGEATATTGGGNGEAGDGDVLRDSQGVVPSGPTYNVDMDSGSMSEDEMMDAEEYDERYGDQLLRELGQSDVAELERLAEDEVTWPDEVEAPTHTPAREFFEGFRGLKSFASSPWDPKENLPAEYARIFQFENFPRTAEAAIEESMFNGVNEGTYVGVDLANVPETFMSKWMEAPDLPLVCFGLFKHENRRSVVHFHLKRTQHFMDPLPSGAPLVIQYGFRRMFASPIYSEDTRQSDKSKFFRFHQPESTAVATIEGPVHFGPASVLAFNPEGVLVSTGKLAGVNPDRLVIKKILLTGDPMKIKKKKAVVKMMFHFRDDILWFKRVELHTKYGRHGHIRCPLGTHGLFKAQFDGVVRSQDTVCMSLYAREYPSFGTTREIDCTDPDYR